MYAISNNYKNLLETSLSFSPKSKIVVDGTIYDGSVIKTYPKISHKNSKMIGGFPTKTCTFDIYDVNGNLDFEGKEITIYRGLDINGTTEWIPQGIFIPTADKITTDISTKTISFSGIQDKSQLFDTLYTTNLNWLDGSTHTGLEIVQDICGTLGITLETTTFNWYNYSFKQPNFPSNITYREVISRLAEIGGSIAYISRTGGLVIKSQTSTGHSIARKRYSKLTREKQFGQITVVVLGKDGVDDDIVYPATLPDNVIEWKILDNPFVDLYREEMIETVASYIIGQSIIPFTLTDFVDGFYLDLNDTVQVTDRNNNTFAATVLNYESTSRLKSSIGADTQTETQTNYNIAGSTKENVRKVMSQVNHITGEINDIVSEIGDRSEKETSITQDIDSIAQQVSQSITLTKDVSNISYVTVEDAFEANVSKLSIVGEMTLLYPSDNLYPSDDLYPLDSYLIIEDEEGTKNKILLPLTYLHYLNATTYDEFVIENGQAKIIRRVGENDDGSLYALTVETIEDKGTCKITLNNGYNKLYLESFFDKAIQYNLKYVYQNDYTEVFATKLETGTLIEQTASSITQTVNAQFEDVNGELQEVSADLELKLNTDDLTTEINAHADEIHLNGYVTMSNLENEGETNINGSNIKTGVIQSTNGNLTLNLNDGTFATKNEIVISKYNQYGILQYETVIDGSKLTTSEAQINSRLVVKNNLDGSDAVTIYQGNITCYSLTQTSLAEKKKNFEKFYNAIDEIKKIDIYKYNLIEEKDGCKKHLGFIIGDKYNYSEKITNNENNQVDLYSMISMCMQAIKEQQEIIEKLEKRIEDLENEIFKNNQ